MLRHPLTACASFSSPHSSFASPSKDPLRYLAIDLGDKRTGLAVGDAITRAALPLDVLEIPIDRAAGHELLLGIVCVCTEHLAPAPLSTNSNGFRVLEPGTVDADFARLGGIVLGLPYNMDGTEGPRAKLVRRWATKIATQTRQTVQLVDERLSSVQADAWMARTGLTHKQKKARRDALAAAAILQRFLAPSWADQPEP